MKDQLVTAMGPIRLGDDPTTFRRFEIRFDKVLHLRIFKLVLGEV